MQSREIESDVGEKRKKIELARGRETRRSTSKHSQWVIYERIPRFLSEKKRGSTRQEQGEIGGLSSHYPILDP